MKFAKHRSSKFIIIAILSILMTTSIVLSPNVNAHTPAWNIPTYAYINVAPSPAGIGQQVTVGFWLDIVPPTANGVWGDRWQGMKVTVTKLDGTNQTLGPYTTDDTGGTSLIYTPEALGNYTFQMYYPGQTLAGNNPAPGSTSPFIGDFYESAISPPVTLTVQTDSSRLFRKIRFRQPTGC